MATLKSIPLSQILVLDRERPVDEDVAQAYAANMAEVGLINPITVRSTPAANGGKTPYTLVTGAHRLRAAAINEWPEIDAIVVSKDVIDAQLMELSENIYRTLSELDRAAFLASYREVWEQKNGKIDRTRNLKVGRTSPKSNDWTSGKQCSDCSDIFAPGRALSERAQDLFGFGKSTYFNVVKIGKITPALRAALRGTPAENDQKVLLKLAGMPETEQSAIVGALKVEPDVYKALDILKPEKPKANAQATLLKKMLADWTKAEAETRGAFLAQIGIDPLDVPEVIDDGDLFREAAE